MTRFDMFMEVLPWLCGSFCYLSTLVTAERVATIWSYTRVRQGTGEDPLDPSNLLGGV